MLFVTRHLSFVIRFMSTLIAQLAQLIAQDNAVLFVGASLRQADVSAPAIEQLAETLAAQIDYQRPDRSLPAIARDYEILRGRNELVLALREELNKADRTPLPIYQLIADAILPKTKIVTTRFDQTLEQALDQFGKPYVIIIRDTDVPFFDESKVTLIKMQGDLNQPDSLVITADDIDAFISRLPTVSDVIRAFFATKTLIFLGYDLNDEQFKRLYGQVTRNLSNFRRKAYAIVTEPVDDIEARYWQGQNVEISLQKALPFLENLAQAVKQAAEQPPPNPNPLHQIAEPALPDRPYKALDSYSVTDAAIFSGRAEESQRLTNRILAHRLTVLYGESGSGKSSLLQAGARPLLAQNRALLVACAPQPGQPMLNLLQQALLEAGLEAGLPPVTDEGLLGILRAWQHALDGPIVLSIDQFEQFFLLYTPQAQQTTIGFLQELLTDRSLDLRLVLVIREDFLGRLQFLEKQIPAVLDMRFRLERLQREDARAAIEQPARLFDVTWEGALVQRLLDDLIENRSDGHLSAGVQPPQLQIVCDYLYQDLIENNGAASGLQITQKRFQALGGTKAILSDYLDRVVAQLPGPQQLSAQVLLGALVSSSGVKQNLYLSELARIANLSPAEAAPILDELTRQRLLRRFEPGTREETAQASYELTHDYLVTRIADWLGDSFWAAQKVRELVRLALPEWQERGRLLPVDDLRLISLQRQNVRFTLTELELIYATAVGYDDDPVSWQIELADDVCRAILLQLLNHQEAFVRREAARRLADFPAQNVAEALAKAALVDADAAVCRLAAEAMARLVAQSETGPAAINQLVSATADPAQTDAAYLALSTIRDLEPAAQALLPQAMRQPIQRRVWHVRWQRHKPHILAITLRAAQGGFWGFGLGFGTFLGLIAVIANRGFALETILQDIVTILQLLTAGIPLAGVVGIVSAGVSAFGVAVLGSLQDEARPWFNWGVQTIIGAALMGAGFIFLTLIFRGTPNPLSAISAGLILGVGLIGSGSLPLVKQSIWLGLGLAIVISISAFFLVDQLDLVNAERFWWNILMGGFSGAGLFWGFRETR